MKNIALLTLLLALSACGGEELVHQSIEKPVERKEKMEKDIQQSVDQSQQKFNEAQKSIGDQ